MSEADEQLPIMLRVAWDRLSQENQLINNRLTWFCTLQGILLAALAFAWKGDTWLVLGLCAISVFISISIVVSCRRANKVIDELDETLKNLLADEFNKYQPVLRWHPSRQGRLSCLMPGFFIPWVFCIFWILACFYRYIFYHET